MDIRSEKDVDIKSEIDKFEIEDDVVIVKLEEVYILISKFLFFKKVLCYKKKIYDYDEDEVCVDY